MLTVIRTRALRSARRASALALIGVFAGGSVALAAPRHQVYHGGTHTTTVSSGQSTSTFGMPGTQLSSDPYRSG